MFDFVVDPLTLNHAPHLLLPAHIGNPTTTPSPTESQDATDYADMLVDMYYATPQSGTLTFTVTAIEQDIGDTLTFTLPNNTLGASITKTSDHDGRCFLGIQRQRCREHKGIPRACDRQRRTEPVQRPGLLCRSIGLIWGRGRGPRPAGPWRRRGPVAHGRGTATPLVNRASVTAGSVMSTWRCTRKRSCRASATVGKRAFGDLDERVPPRSVLLAGRGTARPWPPAGLPRRWPHRPHRPSAWRWKRPSSSVWNEHRSAGSRRLVSGSSNG